MWFGGHGGGGWWHWYHDDQAERPTFSREVLLRVAAYARPYVWQIAGMLATVLVITLIGLVPPLLMRDLIDRAIPNGDAGRLNLLALGMVGVPLTIGLIGVLQRYLGSRIGEGIICDLRRTLFAHLQAMSLRFFTATKTGEIMSRLNNDVVGAQGAITGTFVSVISNVVALVATLAVMLSLEWRLTLAGFLVLPLFILPARRVATILRQIVREQMTLNAQMNALANETLNVSGALLVKLFGRADAEVARYGARAAAVRDIGVRQSVIGRWFFLGISLASALGTALVFWLGGHLVLSGQFTIGTIVAFGAYLGQLYGPISALTNARVELATALVSFERVFEVLDLPVEIQDRPGALAPSRIDGRVEFDRVRFSYRASEGQPPPLKESARRRAREVVGVLTGEMANQRDERRARDGALPNGRTGAPANGRTGDGAAEGIAGSPVPSLADSGPGAAGGRWALRDVSFAVEPGQLAALVGPSGAGKTTTTYLLPRLYDPTEGRILIDGVDLRDLKLEALSANIGMVTQETYLFHDTIRANLLYARPNATQAEIEEACRVANIHDFVAGLPEGYETIVGERGYRLSGGEKQRVAIARVVLKDPRILVLDEATSHLDSQSEALIQAALERVMSGRTSLVIAHRLSTVLKADVILVLDRGELVERGTHRELLARGGLYADLFETQFRHALTLAT
ncbi:MAG TPA: ABC transporter ATP-binding protein [Chloroflexota bacterium]|nr:ABC transporter ATP-binding protein [Chloroflexota bacterium]